MHQKFRNSTQTFADRSKRASGVQSVVCNVAMRCLNEPEWADFDSVVHMAAALRPLLKWFSGPQDNVSGSVTWHDFLIRDSCP